MITIIDFGMGNLGSVVKCFERLGAPAFVSCDPKEIMKADKLVLPGVGHFGRAMQNLREQGIVDCLNYKVMDCGTQILGICLGMQLFASWSAEGDAEGLGWIEARVEKFNTEKMNVPRKIPHMGWNTLELRKDCGVFGDVDRKDAFYFVHSYIVVCEDVEVVAATTYYGYQFVSAVHSGNILGTQFHPEKSHEQGMNIIRRFVELNCVTEGHCVQS